VARGALLALALALAAPAPGQTDLAEQLEAHCVDCHGGSRPEADLDLAAFDGTDLALAAHLAARVRARDMPPPRLGPLDGDERAALLAALVAPLAAAPPDPGRPTQRRLNRAEYGRTVRDLCGVDVRVERDLPEDSSGPEGFDNLGDVLFTTPELAELLQRATGEVVDAVFADEAARARLGLDEEAGVRRLLQRAFRRPPTAAELAARLELLEASGPRAVLASALLSPHFLFRVEQDRDQDEPWRVSDWELATRLSYTLWATMPDDALLEAAGAGRLATEEGLGAEVERMLDDPRSVALAERFAARWLGVAKVPTQAVDVRRFRGTRDELKHAMVAETVRFFDALVREDRSLLELVDADSTFLNATLAQHYGIEGVSGGELRRVALPDRRRGGVLTQASVLTATSQPLRTSPVVRGAWVLERLLGAPPPPPPPDAGVLPADDQLEDGLTLRQRLARHREDKSCASCHARIDPIGFALENYDGVGRWRDADHVGPIDARATLPDGRELDGVVGLKDALLAEPERVARAVTEALLVYALGRSLEPADVPIVDGIVADLAQGGWGTHRLVRAVLRSYPLLHRRRAR